MNISIFGRIALLALLGSVTACSFDRVIGVAPTITPPIQKATVEPARNPVQPTVANSPEEPLPSPAQSPSESPNNGSKPSRVIPPAPSVTQQEVQAVVNRNGRSRNLPSSPDLVYRNAVLTEDTVLRGEVQVNGWLTVPPQVTLTVEPGTVIRFSPEQDEDVSGAGLLVQGRILAIGSPERQIVFTGSYSPPLENDWQGIVLLATEKKNLLEECRMEGAAVALDGYNSQVTLRAVMVSASVTAIRLRDTYANIAGGSVSSCGQGIESINSELELRDINLSSNRKGVMVSGGSLYLSGSTFYGNSQTALVAANCTVKISGCSFTVNGTGIVLTGAEGAVSSNRVLSNRDAGVVLTNSRIRVNANNISQNSSVGLRISGAGSIVWGNVIASNNGHDLEYTGDADLAVMGNWWGDISRDRIRSRVRTGDSSGKAMLMPILSQRPQTVQ